MAASRKPAAGLSATAAGGDRTKTLTVLRDLLAAQIETCESARDTAALTARFLEVLEQIAALPPAKKGTALDELAARRATGDGVAARAVRPGRRSV